MRLGTVATALACLAIPTIASAHGGNNDPNVVHACVGNVSKIVRIVGVSGSCIAAPPLVAETPAHWEIQGPNGTPGANGTNGMNGTSVTFVDYFSGSTYQGAPTGCPNGGAVYGTGTPTVYAYVCNGRTGVDGKDGTTAPRAAGPCFDNANRYVDCGNGTVTDTVTGLIWLKQWNCLPSNTWAAAVQAAAGLKDGACGLTDKSAAGDWRLPTKDEWSATFARAVALGCRLGGLGVPPSLTNDAGDACYGSGVGSSFAGVASDFYWSSTSYEAIPSNAWVTYLVLGIVFNNVKYATSRVWPVRGGPR